MGKMVCRDTRPNRTMPALAGNIRYSGGSGACIRRSGEAIERIESENQLRNAVDCTGGIHVIITHIIETES